MTTLQVPLASRSYPIYISPGAFDQLSMLLTHITGQQVCIVTNETIAPLYLEAIKLALSGISQVDQVILPDGEQYKTLETLSSIFDHLAQRGHHRTTTLIALGGGVIGDITGFAAACYQRGVAFIQLPTTLLAMIDASVGGKTAVNLALGKNLVGAFYQPRCVVIDPEVLNTLPQREYRAGLAEAIKYGYICDEALAYSITEQLECLIAKDQQSLSLVIAACCQIKAQLVGEDETEKGVRALLNFGHTFAHAIEKLTAYQQFLHGEAVSIGMVMAADLSMRLGLISKSYAQQIKSQLSQMYLPVTPPKHIKPKDFIDAMLLDKKSTDQAINFILLEKIGKAIVYPIVLEQLDILEPTLSAKHKLCE